MEKKIVDYLHLYIGSKIRYAPLGGEYFDETMTGIDGWKVLTENEPDYSCAAEECKLILRPLSSMTEEEMQECGNMVYDFSGDPDLNKWEPKDFEIGLAPEQFYWLLSKHFDLFNLIPEGLALDATQQPQ